ncbi:MAG: DUF5794 domain-containing protein [Salinirussus sp.]
MSSSRHPLALAVERRVDDATRMLAVVMCLPLVDGIFPALVLAGALGTPTGIVEVGLLVFGGSATVAVILAEMDDGPGSPVRPVLAVGAVVVALAVVEAALAPTIAGVLDLAIFERFAAVVILAVAARTASARIAEFIPRPAVVVGLGLIASLDPAGATLTVRIEPVLLARAFAASGIGVGFAVLVALVSPWLRDAVDLDRFRFGSAVALGVLALSILPVRIVPAEAPVALAVLAVTAVLAFDPDQVRRRDDTRTTGDETVSAPDGADQDTERAPWL